MSASAAVMRSRGSNVSSCCRRLIAEILSRHNSLDFNKFYKINIHHPTDKLALPSSQCRAGFPQGEALHVISISCLPRVITDCNHFEINKGLHDRFPKSLPVIVSRAPAFTLLSLLANPVFTKRNSLNC